jgi:hypothetical protein
MGAKITDRRGCGHAFDGDRHTCPATDADRELGVSLTHPGRYRIEAVAVLIAHGRATH